MKKLCAIQESRGSNAMPSSSLPRVKSHKLPECCRCNDKSSCLRCKSVKNNSHFVNCLPLKRGHCRNARPDLASYPGLRRRPGTHRSTHARLFNQLPVKTGDSVIPPCNDYV